MNIRRLNVSNNIFLAPLRTDDEAINTYTRWINDEEILHFISRNSLVMGIEKEKEWAKSKNGYGFNIVFINDKNEEVLVGNCDIRKQGQDCDLCYSLGICIGEKEYREKGVGSEVIKALIKFGFEQLNAHCIFLTLNGDNIRAYKCYSKSGLKECGRLKESLYYDGKYADKVFMQILRKDYFSEKIEN